MGNEDCLQSLDFGPPKPRWRSCAHLLPEQNQDPGTRGLTKTAVLLAVPSVLNCSIICSNLSPVILRMLCRGQERGQALAKHLSLRRPWSGRLALRFAAHARGPKQHLPPRCCTRRHPRTQPPRQLHKHADTRCLHASTGTAGPRAPAGTCVAMRIDSARNMAFQRVSSCNPVHVGHHHHPRSVHVHQPSAWRASSPRGTDPTVPLGESVPSLSHARALVQSRRAPPGRSPIRCPHERGINMVSLLYRNTSVILIGHYGNPSSLSFPQPQ